MEKEWNCFGHEAFLYTPQTGLSTEDVSTEQINEEHVRSVMADTTAHHDISSH